MRWIEPPQTKTGGQVLYGLLHSQSCKLTEIGRALKEKTVLKKTVERLRLGLFHLDEEQREQLMGNHLSQVRAYVDESSILIGRPGVRTVDRGYDALAYYEYFFPHNEPFVIRCKKNRDVVYIGSSMFVAALVVQARRVDSIFKPAGKLEFLFYTLACAFSSLLRMAHKPLRFHPRRTLPPCTQLSFL